MYVDALTLPCGRYGETLTVRAHVVVTLTHNRRVDRVFIVPGISHIRIYLIAVTVHLKQTGNRKINPLAVIKVLGKEILRLVISILYKVEFPLAFN